MKENRIKIIIGALMLIFITFVATSGAYLYIFRANAADIINAFKLFHAAQLIKANYVEDVPGDTIMSGAVKGMVNSLNDPHSTYMDAKMYKDFMIETEGSFGGVGIVIGTKDKLLTVVAPIEGTPGEKAGIKSGDRIIKIDGVDTKDMAVDQAVAKIRGSEGSKVVLTIKRDGQEDKDYTLVRSSIQIKTVSGKMLDDGIGYIRIAMFNENTGNDFFKKFDELESQGMKAVVLDLRDNPGGLLLESVKIAGKFVPQGTTVVSVVSKNGERKDHSSNMEGNFSQIPLIVLINGGSASASEIVAGAVQDTNAGTLIGTKTYGKGSVQTVMRLNNDTAIKLTIAKYLTPKDRAIDGIGLEPDLQVELPVIDKERLNFHNNFESLDSQLQKAIEVLKEKI